MMKNLNQQMEKTRTQKEKIDSSLKARTVTGSAGAGLVEIRINGLYEVEDVSVDETLLNRENKGVLETLIASAFNEACSLIEGVREAEMKKSLQDILGGTKA